MPHVLERCLHGGFWAATVNALSQPMAVFGLLAWSVIDNAAPAGGALTGALIGNGLCAIRKVDLPLPDIGWRTVLWVVGSDCLWRAVRVHGVAPSDVRLIHCRN